MSRVTNCQHIKTNGVQCGSGVPSTRRFCVCWGGGSPALHGQNHCYFHSQQYELRRRKRKNTKPPACEWPPLEDANAVQVAVMEVARALLEDRLDNRRAGLLLYALQIASCNLNRVNFEPFSLQLAAMQAQDRQRAERPDQRSGEPMHQSDAEPPTGNPKVHASRPLEK